MATDRNVSMSLDEAKGLGLNLNLPSDRIVTGIWLDMRANLLFGSGWDGMSMEESRALLHEWRDFARKTLGIFG